MEQGRRRAAELMGVAPADVAVVKNTTEGLGFVASGLEWCPGDRVLLPEDEFPSTAYPWLALEDRGVVVDRVPVHQLAAALETGPAPKVVATSWVQAGRGWRTDLAALANRCHDAGALLCVDAVQGLGVVPADLAGWGVDAAAASSFKWLLGPEGAGVLYVRDELLDRLRERPAVVREVRGVDAARGDAGEDRDAQLREAGREMPQHADLVGAPRPATREHERQLAVVGCSMRQGGESVRRVGAHARRIPSPVAARRHAGRPARRSAARR
jgi:selenocysteine lyase/cysteine desulfurase